MYAAKTNQFLWCLNCSCVYFSGRRSLQPLLIGYFLTTVKIAEYTWDHIVNTNVNVFYSKFTQTLKRFMLKLWQERFLYSRHSFNVSNVYYFNFNIFTPMEERQTENRQTFDSLPSTSCLSSPSLSLILIRYLFSTMLWDERTSPGGAAGGSSAPALDCTSA